MNYAKIDQLARIVWNYHHLHHALKKSDIIFCLGSSDIRVAEHAAQLFLDGYGDYMLFSGGFGRLTEGVFAKPEAEIFADIALKMGVPEDKILIESKSSNTGENIQLSYRLLQEHDIKAKSFILVQKPYMERRTFATFKKQWPDSRAEILVTSPQIDYDDYFNDTYAPKEEILSVMVGDMQRIKDYPALGFQIEQDIPADVWAANEQLITLGYNKHLIKD